MSRSPAFVAFTRACGLLVCGLALALTTACHQRSSAPARPSSPAKVNADYGQQSRDETGGKVQSVISEDPRDVEVKRVEELLLGRVAGVHVVPTPGGGFSIRIRGASVPGDREPLYVVDGMPVEVTPDRGLAWLDPADIARIDVLKNPAETTMYGGRGANGVIVITTKRSNEGFSRPHR